MDTRRNRNVLTILAYMMLFAAFVIWPCCSNGGGSNGADGGDSDTDSDSDTDTDSDSDSDGDPCENGEFDPDLGEVMIDCGGDCEPCFSGTTYYVSNEGSDLADGTSPETAWETITKVNGTTFQPGDGILFRRGDMWRDMLVVGSSGTDTDPITFAAYGQGEAPKIVGSSAVTTWTQVTNGVPSSLQGRIWMGDQQVTDPSMGANHNGQSQGSGGWPGGSYFVLQNGTVVWGHQEKELGSGYDTLEEEFDWGWMGDHVYIYSEVDPSTVYASMEVSQRSSAIEFDNSPSWLTFFGLQMLFTQSKGLYTGYVPTDARGLVVSHCHVAWVGIKNGLAADGIKTWYSGSQYTNNEIHDCGRHGIGYLILTQGNVDVSDITIEGNHFYNGWHTTGIDIQVANSSDSMSGFLIKGNLFEGDPTDDLGAEEGHNSNHIWINPYGGTLSDMSFINNVFTYCHGKCLSLNNVDDVNVFNNTFFGVNPTLSNYQAQLSLQGDFNNFTVRNNIFYNDSTTGMFRSIKTDNTSGIDVDYNLYFTTEEGGDIIRIENTSSTYEMDDWGDYQTTVGWDLNSPDPSDPAFVDPPDDLHPGSGSEALGNGIALPEVTTDYNGDQRNDPPTIGAFE